MNQDTLTTTDLLASLSAGIRVANDPRVLHRQRQSVAMECQKPKKKPESRYSPNRKAVHAALTQEWQTTAQVASAAGCTKAQAGGILGSLSLACIAVNNGSKNRRMWKLA